MKLDINAPIIPFEGLGGISLYSTREELKELLNSKTSVKHTIFDGTIEYQIGNDVLLFFSLANDRLFKISALENYKGKLFKKIKIGTTEEELIAIEPSFKYNNFEEFWETSKGASIETDSTHRVICIGVYVHELLMPEFRSGKW